MNQFKTFLLMLLLTGILIFIGDMIGNKSGMIIGCAIALVTNFISYFFSDKIVLSVYGAKDADPNDRLYRIVRNLTAKAGMPMPRVCIINEYSPNAFATGRNPHHAAVCATSGILNLLNDSELEGVIAHELSHIKNRDILISSVAAGICGVISILFRIFAFFGGGDDDRRGNGCATLIVMLIGMFAATLIQLWISRTREYIADESGAKMCGKPWALADALGKLANGVANTPMKYSTPETRNMFIVNPINTLFSTHPPIEDRIDRLRKMQIHIN